MFILVNYQSYICYDHYISVRLPALFEAYVSIHMGLKLLLINPSNSDIEVSTCTTKLWPHLCKGKACIYIYISLENVQVIRYYTKGWHAKYGTITKCTGICTRKFLQNKNLLINPCWKTGKIVQGYHMNSMIYFGWAHLARQSGKSIQ